MKQLDLAELSGLLDGELDPARAAEVREAIEKDPDAQVKRRAVSAVVGLGGAARFASKESLAR